MELNPNNHEILNRKSVSLTGLGAYEEAIQVLNLALELSPNNTKILNNKGAALNNLGKYQDAIQILNLALELNILARLS